MLSVEGSVMMRLKSTSANFVSGLAVLFAAYFVFNIHYDPEAETTLELLQRYVQLLQMRKTAAAFACCSIARCYLIFLFLNYSLN